MSKGRWWPWSLGAVLAATIGGNLWVLSLARNDPSFAVEPDYYRKAIEWDSTQAVELKSEALGWSLDARMTPNHDETAISLSLRDRSGTAIPDVRIEADARHMARAARVFPLDLRVQTDSTYVGTIPSARMGLWEVRLIATRAQERYVATLRLESAREFRPGE